MFTLILTQRFLPLFSAQEGFQENPFCYIQDEILISVRVTPDSPEIIPMLKKSVKTFELELVWISRQRLLFAMGMTPLLSNMPGLGFIKKSYHVAKNMIKIFLQNRIELMDAVRMAYNMP